MKLRNFLYLDMNIINDYLGAINGYVHENEIHTEDHANQKGGGIKAKVSGISANGSIGNNQSKQVRRQVVVTDAAKFDKVYMYLEKQQELEYYEFFDEESFNSVMRDSFIEALVSPRLSKLRSLSNAVQKFGDLVQVFQDVADQDVLDPKTKEAINGFRSLNAMASRNGLKCVFSFEDEKFPLIAQLNEDCLKVELDNIIGQVYLLCKIQRKIPKGQSVKLDELLEQFKSMPMNRKEKRKLPKKMNNPEVIKDEVKGPAFTVLPIAMYQ